MAKRVWIFGVGKFGKFVASQILSETNLNLVLVDKNENKLSPFTEQDIPLHVCDIELTENLDFLDVGKDDFYLVLMSSNVGASILTIQSLIEHKIAKSRIFVRVINSQHRKIIEMLGITKLIDPNDLIARKIILDISKRIEVTYFDSNNYVFKLQNDKVDNCKITDLSSLQKHKINVLLIFRSPPTPTKNSSEVKNKEGQLLQNASASQTTNPVIYPSGQTVIYKNDEILLLVPKDKVDKANGIFRK